MKRKIMSSIILASITFILLTSTLNVNLEGEYSLHECRLWGIVANTIPYSVVMDQLVNLPNSLKNLGANNPNGWGLAYYSSNEPVVLRGQLPANTDPQFVVAAGIVASSGGAIAVGHVRRASSGLINIPDPHPFERFKNGVWWLFCHNGGIDKNVLVGLIGIQYLTDNPPTVGSNQNEWIDSELYFIYVLKCCEENSWNIDQGIIAAIINICNRIPGTSETLNFVFTDGTTIWGFRKGNTLYYYYNSVYSAVASQYPTSTQSGWISLTDYSLIKLSTNSAPSIVHTCYMLTVFVRESLIGRAIYGANVYLDNVYMGITDYFGRLAIQTVSPGSHSLKVTKKGYYDSSTTINVASDTTITMVLKKK
jgi:predicted glutamine amidotransferase